MTVKRTYEKHEADKITFRYRDQVVAASSAQSGSGGFMENSAGSRTCDKAGSPWAVLGETAWQIDSAVPFFCFHLFCLCFCAFLRNLLSLRYFCSRRHGFQGVGAFMFYVVFVTRLPGCSISGVSRVNSCSVSAGFQVFLKQSFHFLRVRGIDDADTGIVDVDVLMPHAVDLPRFMYHDP